MEIIGQFVWHDFKACGWMGSLKERESSREEGLAAGSRDCRGVWAPGGVSGQHMVQLSRRFSLNLTQKREEVQI